MNGTLETVTVVASLSLTLWSLVAALRNRAPDLAQMIGLGVVELTVLVLIGAVVVATVGGEHPADPTTFIGYAITTVCLPPVAAVLARMEPTRWGSATVCFGMLVLPVLVVRLDQLWWATNV